MAFIKLVSATISRKLQSKNKDNMKNKLFKVTILFLIILTSCSKDEEFKTISPSSISFVHQDGSPILQGECINPNTNYAILIKTNATGDGDFRNTKIEYTLNGVPLVMSFNKDGEQLNPIKLVDGNNTAEIIGGGFKINLYYNTHNNYELVQ